MATSRSIAKTAPQTPTATSEPETVIDATPAATVEHRATVPHVPNTDGLSPATEVCVSRVRGFLLPAVYTSNPAEVAYAIDNINATNLREVHPDGREYRAEVLDYLAGRAKKLAG